MAAFMRTTMHVIIIFLFMALNIKPTVWYVKDQNKIPTDRYVNY
jgi:hypothetical protein